MSRQTLLGCLFTFAIGVAIGLLIHFATNSVVGISQPTGNSYATTTEEDFSKYENCDPNQSNGGYTACVIASVDRIAAEREWKQRKFETASLNEINPRQNSPYTPKDESPKVKVWRVNFEKYRNSWCEATNIYPYVNGYPIWLANCMINVEKQAILDLNSYYYNFAVSRNGASIPNFEPTEEQVIELTKTNMTDTTGCLWADDPDCTRD